MTASDGERRGRTRRRRWSRLSALLRHRRLQGPLRVAAAAAWVGLAVLSLPSAPWPGEATRGAAMPLAFGLAALVTRLAFRFTRSRWQLIAVVAAAALLELWRMSAPGGQASLHHWIGDAAGAVAGILVGRAIDHVTWRLRSKA